MEPINLPSPPHLLQLFIRIAMSMMTLTFSIAYRRAILPSRRSYAEFDIDSETGFFPRNRLPRLPEPYTLWEQALEDAGGWLNLGTEDCSDTHSFDAQWRAEVAQWPVFEIETLLANPQLLKRAHYVLAWLISLYVHSQPPCGAEMRVIVPRSLAMPILGVSRRLGIAPVLTFADTVLWNCEAENPAYPLSMNNLKVVNLFSGTEDERNFYIASAKAELRGVEALRIIEEYNHLPNLMDINAIAKVSRDLTKLARIIDDISNVIQSVRPGCDPHVFYNSIRPWYDGSGAGGLDAAKWTYEGADNSDRLDLSGPSAGQSSVMHAIDIFLDIDHKLRQRRYPAPSEANKTADRGFMERMRRYMPGRHREYLQYLCNTPKSVRELAKSVPTLRDSYDSAVMAMKRLRDQHMRIACLYIVSMRPSRKTGCPVLDAMARRQELGPSLGTGGNEVASLLKAGRDATRRAALRVT